MRNVRAAWIGATAIAMVCVGFLASPTAALAQESCNGGQTITLDSDATTGVYTYFITSPSCFLAAGTLISFSGMGGVTDALVQAGSPLTEHGATWHVTFTSSTADFDVTEVGPFLNSGNNGVLEIDCSSCVTGTVDWTIGAVEPTLPGPVSASTTVPEPASLALLGTAVVGLAAIRRRRKSA